jgi:hypothetical protein
MAVIRGLKLTETPNRWLASGWEFRLISAPELLPFLRNRDGISEFFLTVTVIKHKRYPI